MKKILPLFMLILLFSCQSYEIRYNHEAHLPSHLDEFQGASLAVYPTDVDFGAIRFTIDLRDVTVEVDGQEIQLQDRYISEVDDDDYGRLGILDGNIFRKAGLSEEFVSQQTTRLLAMGAMGAQDYNVGFFKGFGEGNMGHLSNRPLSWDTSQYPSVPVYSGEPVAPVFTTVKQVSEAITPQQTGCEYVMYSHITLDSEVAEILVANQDSGFDPDAPREGDYCLFLRAGVYCEVKDLEGNTVFTSNTNLDYPLYSLTSEVIILPVTPGNADEFAKYFRELDYSEIAQSVLEDFVPRVYPLLNSYFVNTSYRVAIEEE